MTEDEAKDKWCPFARVSETGGRSVAINRDAEPWPTCVASKCMAWRWRLLMADAAYLEAVKLATKEAKASGGNPKLAAQHVNDNRAKYGLPVKSFDGYCGLAGQP